MAMAGRATHGPGSGRKQVTDVTHRTIDSTTAALLLAAADPVRWAVLQQLADASACVCDLRAPEPIAPNLMSYHLKVLRDAGLVVGTRRGRRISYRLTDGALQRLHDALPGSPARADGATCRTSTPAAETPNPGSAR